MLWYDDVRVTPLGRVTQGRLARDADARATGPGCLRKMKMRAQQDLAAYICAEMCAFLSLISSHVSVRGVLACRLRTPRVSWSLDRGTDAYVRMRLVHRRIPESHNTT